MDQTPDPIQQCHERRIPIRVEMADTMAAREAWADASPAETMRVLNACVETVTGLAEDVLARVLPYLWPDRAIPTPDLRTLLEPHAVAYIAREIAARAALADRRMRLGEPA